MASSFPQSETSAQRTIDVNGVFFSRLISLNHKVVVFKKMNHACGDTGVQ